MTDHVLRPMRQSDLEQVLTWRNHPSVRRYMFSAHVIGLDEHREWYHRTSESPVVTHLIYEQKGLPCGFVNITRTRCADIADWGFYLAPDAPRGSGRALGENALHYAFVKLKLHKICGQALRFNTRSIAFHKRLGFTEEGCLRDQHFTGSKFHDVICFGLLSDDWRMVRGERND